MTATDSNSRVTMAVLQANMEHLTDAVGELKIEVRKVTDKHEPRIRAVEKRQARDEERWDQVAKQGRIENVIGTVVAGLAGILIQRN